MYWLWLVLGSISFGMFVGTVLLGDPNIGYSATTVACAAMALHYRKGES